MSECETCDGCKLPPDDGDELVDGLCYDCRIKAIRKRREVRRK